MSDEHIMAQNERQDRQYVVKTEPENGCIQVVLLDGEIPRFDAWLHLNGEFERFPIPVAPDELPTFGIRPKIWPPQ